MVLKYGNEINDIEEEQAERPWFRYGTELVVMMLILLLILGGVYARASTKSIVISESIRGISGESMFEEDVFTDWSVLPVAVKNNDSKIYVPIPIMARPENISVENYYQDHTLFIRIKGVHAANFEDVAITGATNHVLAAAFREYGGEVRVSLLMDGIWDFNISQENSQLVIEPYKSSDRYENTLALVVNDETSEAVAEIAADLCASLQNGVAGRESAEEEEVYVPSARIYVAEYRSKEDILGFIQDSESDMVLILNTAQSDDPGQYGMSARYNGNYFIPELDNGTVAECFLRNMAVSAKNRAVSITSSAEDSILNDLEIPAAEITIGYTTNELEGTYLLDEKYRAKIAEGIINAVKEVTER